MFIVSPATVWNRSALETRAVPRKVFGRVTLVPRRGLNPGTFLRMVFEAQELRYILALTPFIAAAAIWRDYALAISQAPVPMLMVVYMVETRLLRVPPHRRAGLIEPAEAERGLDLLRVRALAILTEIAARRNLGDGRLHLVVEQSDMARFPPLTLVSVQSEDGPEVLRLDAAETRLIRETLFQPPLDERRLHRINLSRNEFLRDIPLEARSISAHARLAAMMG